MVSLNGYAINVQWYKQKCVGVLEYVMYTGSPVAQSNSDLVYAGFDEYTHQVHSSRIRVPRQRTVRSNCMDDFGLLPERVNLQTSEGDWYRRDFGNVWCMNAEVRDKATERAGFC